MGVLNKKYLDKKYFVVIILFLLSMNVSSQETNLQLNAFQTSIISIITSSPLGCGVDCKSKIFLLKITLNKSAKNAEISISDGLDSLCKNDLKNNLSKIDTRALASWAISKNYFSTTLLLGIYCIVI